MFLKRKCILIGLISATILFSPFIGFDRYIGDHDVNDFWEMFIKNSPSFQFRFHNPAQLVLDIEPFDNLNELQKEEMRRYCKTRYWVDDIAECYRLVRAGRY